MPIAYHKFYSGRLGREMEFKVYGRSGQPVIVFPSSGGRFYEYEDFGMVEACRPWIDAGRLTLVTVDSVDHQTWLDKGRSPMERARGHNRYDAYIVEELIPWVRQTTGWQQGLLTTGCSMGAYHAANFFFRHPGHFDSVVALSGVYHADFFTDQQLDGDIYFHSPISYLPNLTDPWYLERYRRSRIIFCVGQGAWEGEMLHDTRLLQGILEAKQIPAWFDYWGHDVAHDWPWWRLQIAYFLKHLFGEP